MKKPRPSTRGLDTLKDSMKKPKLLLKGGQSIRNVLKLIGDLKTTPHRWTLKHAIATIDIMRVKTQSKKPPTSTEWIETFLGLGKFARQQLGERFNRWTFIRLLLQKHEMYGSEPLFRWGSSGVLMRIDSKLSRYVNLILYNDAKTVEESATDTLMDILGYCVLGYYLSFYTAGNKR